MIIEQKHAVYITLQNETNSVVIKTILSTKIFTQSDAYTILTQTVTSNPRMQLKIPNIVSPVPAVQIQHLVSECLHEHNEALKYLHQKTELVIQVNLYLKV